jgi:hypothetical protein
MDSQLDVESPQCPATAGPDAADRDAQPGTDLLVRQLRRRDEQEEHPLLGFRQPAQRRTDGLSRLVPQGALLRTVLVAGQIEVVVVERPLPGGRVQFVDAPAPGRRQQPRGQSFRIADPADVLEQPQPGHLDDVGGLFVTEPEPAGRPPQQ